LQEENSCHVTDQDSEKQKFDWKNEDNHDMFIREYDEFIRGYKRI